MTRPAEDWRRLGATIRAERNRNPAWRRRSRFAAACGLSARTIEALETGERTNFSSETLTAIETTLGWKPGSIRRVLHGLSAVREDDERLARLCLLWPRLSADAQRLLVALAEEALGNE